MNNKVIIFFVFILVLILLIGVPFIYAYRVYQKEEIFRGEENVRLFEKEVIGYDKELRKQTSLGSEELPIGYKIKNLATVETPRTPKGIYRINDILLVYLKSEKAFVMDPNTYQLLYFITLVYGSK